MTRRAPIPFDPDAHGSAVHVHAAPQGETMLSQLIDAQDWHGTGDSHDAPRGTAKPLSNHQKWKLSDLAEAVYNYLRSQGELVGENVEGYRHRIAIKACGRRISQASHGDFKLIQAAFLKERGRVEAARRALAQAQATPQAIALHKIWELCSQTKTPTSTPHTLAARFYKGAQLGQLNTRQLWTLFYTIRNNANAKAGKGSPANRFKSKRRKSA